MTLYDTIGRTYCSVRRSDRRIGALITAALGDVVSVVNVGAGAGAYEPEPTIAAIEPSEVMITQRPTGSAPVVRAVAEQMPLRDKCADAAMALLTVHHWADVAAGVAEMRRIARHRVVILTWNPEVFASFWLAEYLPELTSRGLASAVPISVLTGLLPNARVHPVPIPHDCADGFAGAYWRRPQAYLDPDIRAGMSVLAKAGDAQLRLGLDRLDHDLRTGRWHARHASLLELDSLDVGYSLVIADPD